MSYNDGMSPMMTAEQVAELLGYHVAMIRLFAREGRLPAHRGPNGREWLFDRDELFDWMRQHRVVPEVHG
jgi:excisionase family DNA binding protein